MESNKKRLIRIAMGAVLFTAAVLVNTNSSIIKAVLFLAPFIIIGGDVILKAFKNIVRGRIFDENFLMSIATIGAFFNRGISGRRRCHAVLPGRGIISKLCRG